MDRTRQVHWPRRIAGVVATLLLHALLFQSLTLGSLAAKRVSKQTEGGPGSTAILSAEGAWMTLVIVRSPGANEAADVVNIASRGIAVADPLIQIASPDPLPLAAFEESTEEDGGETSHTAGNPAMQSMLFGRYTGQIDARIQRAWRKPRSPINEAMTAT